MDLIAQLPTMTDTSLANLAANAARLSQSGSTKQQAAATALLPAIEAEISSRKVEKPVRAPRAKKKTA